MPAADTPRLILVLGEGNGRPALLSTAGGWWTIVMSGLPLRSMR